MTRMTQYALAMEVALMTDDWNERNAMDLEAEVIRYRVALQAIQQATDLAIVQAIIINALDGES
jgi:hypothetical protein